MLELIIGIVLLVIALYIVVYGSIFFIAGMAYGYWGLSIGMVPVLWILMGIGALVGLICALKNAIKAARELKGKGVK